MRGSYQTRQRAAIDACMRAHKGEHMTVDGWMQALMNHGVTVGRSTVYRYLELMREKGKVKQFAAGDGSACFAYVEDEISRGVQHVLCTGCGRVEHVDCGAMDMLMEHMAQNHGFAVDKSRTVLYGRCSRCSEEEK